MTRNDFRAALAVLSVLAGGSALSQERGRTDGAEGTEFGKGGYERIDRSQFSLELDWGAAVSERSPLSARQGAPLFIGATVGYWADDWFVMEAAGAYLFNNGQVNFLVGPKLRTGYAPISLNVGLKAGLMTSTDTGPLFGLSPSVGADILIRRKILVGLNYAIDLPIGRGSLTSHRVYMNVGYRF